MTSEELFKQNIKCYDRFTFDFIFRQLLAEGFNHEEALDLILCNCFLSAIIFQERIENNLYKEINLSNDTSIDLLQLKSDIYNELKHHELN